MAAVAAILATGALFSPAAAAAEPVGDPAPIGDTGSAVIDGGSSMINGCVQDVGSCFGRLLDGGSSVLGTGSGILSGGSSSGPGATQPCNQSTKSGEEGVTTTTHTIGRTGPTSFDLSWDTEDIPDEIVVLYQGVPIANTGYVGGQKGTQYGSIRVDVPAGSASSVAVRVTGPSGTVWTYTVHCPV